MLQKLLLLTFLLLTLPQTANAYWLESEPELFSLREREHAPLTKGEMFYTIQDNFELFTDRIDPGPLLLPHSDYFVPADIIDINLPLFGIFSHPAKQAEDPIANLLYANLKIKKLLEEYSEIQKRAEELLGDERGNHPEGKIEVNADTESANLKTGEQDQISIYKKLHQKLISISTLNLSETNVDDAETHKDPQAPLAGVSMFSYLHLQKKAASLLQTAKLRTYNSTGTGSMAATEAPPNHVQQPKFSGNQAQDNQYSGEISLPWVLELPVNIFNYLISHKVQAIFIGLFGLMIINIFFGSRS